MVRMPYTPEQILNKLRKAETLFSHSIVVSGGVRLSPVSPSIQRENQFKSSTYRPVPPGLEPTPLGLS